MAETAAEKKKREAKEAAAAKAKQEREAVASNSNSGDGSVASGDVSSTSGDNVTDAQQAVDQANSQKAEDVAQRASEKDAADRTPAEIKAAAEVAKADVLQEQYDAAKKVEDDARQAAEKNDVDEDEIDYGLTDRIIQQKLEEGTTPKARANELEDYTLKQQLYQQAGLSAPDVLATANAAAKVKAD